LALLYSSGMVARLHKKFVKDAMLEVMEDLRFIARDRSLDVVYGIATNLFEWQIVRYEMSKEINQQSSGFEISDIRKLYYKDKQYTYADIDMK